MSSVSAANHSLPVSDGSKRLSASPDAVCASARPDQAPSAAPARLQRAAIRSGRWRESRRRFMTAPRARWIARKATSPSRRSRRYSLASRLGDRVPEEGHGPRLRQRSTGQQRGPVGHADAGERDDVPEERGPRVERGRAADRPVDVAPGRGHPIDDDDVRVGRGGLQRAANLEDPDGAGVVLRVERERPRELRRRTDVAVDAGSQRQAE